VQQSDSGWSGNRSRFVQYPTQTGAFWQWAGNTDDSQRFAWHPIGDAMNFPRNHIFGNWYTNATTPNLATLHETCPPGFRRPQDGPNFGTNTRSNETSEMVRESEMRQSLFLNPQTGWANISLVNSVFGLYADGFFDRRPIATLGGGYFGGPCTVAAGTADIAHRGMLLFNSASGASLFLPATGFRYSNLFGGRFGVALNAGNWGYILSSTQGSVGPTTRWDLTFNPSNAYMWGGSSRACAFPVRCVAE
jgi:hypothetical protein